MSKKNIRKNFYVIFFVMFLCFNVGYSYINSSLFIDGVAIVNAKVFNVEFNNIIVKTGSIENQLPVIEDNTISNNLAFNSTGDFYEFTFDVENTGDINAMIGSFNIMPTISGEIANYIKYDVSYENRETVALNQAVDVGTFVRFRVRVEYIGPNSDNDFYIGFSVNINYIENDGTGVYIRDNGIFKQEYTVVKGSVTTVGSEIDIGGERFYIVSSDGETMTLLSKYNLYIDGKYSESTDNRILYGTAATGIQNSSMRGWISSSDIAQGVTHFSETKYWSKSGVKYPLYVYSNNANSNVYQYVENYKTYLEGKGVIIDEARLITLEELETLGCSYDDATCSGAPSWVYYTTYWTGNAYSSTYVIAVYSDKEFGYDSFDNDFGLGVRPVIVLKI